MERGLPDQGSANRVRVVERLDSIKGRLVGVAAVATVAACAVERQEPNEPQRDSIEALVSIERAEYLDGDEARAEAAAHFARIPSDLNAAALFEALGLVGEYPPLGECFIGDSEPVEVPEDVFIDFVDGGDVVIRANGTETALSRHAVLSLSDVISGVVYTTQDRAAEPFPSGHVYRAISTGGEDLAPITLEGEAPETLDDVRLEGLAWEYLPDVPVNGPVEVSWAAGDHDDVIVIEFSSDNAVYAQCAFADGGRAIVPAAAVPTTGNGYVSIRRLRVVDVETAHANGAELRFDFSVHAPVVYGSF
jgi:hypothetical protein